MARAKKGNKPKKVILTFEVEENSTNCAECVFGASCPYVCEFANRLDCSKYNLHTLKLIKEEYGEQKE